jgi:hypothetical protein
VYVSLTGLSYFNCVGAVHKHGLMAKCADVEIEVQVLVSVGRRARRCRKAREAKKGPASWTPNYASLVKTVTTDYVDVRACI